MLLVSGSAAGNNFCCHVADAANALVMLLLLLLPNAQPVPFIDNSVTVATSAPAADVAAV